MTSKPSLREHGRQPRVLLCVLAALCLAALWAPPAGRTSWLLEVTPGLVMVAWLATIYRRTPLSHWVYAGVFVHVLIAPWRAVALLVGSRGHDASMARVPYPA